MKLVEVLVFLIPATILIVPGFAEVSGGVLAAMGIMRAVKNRQSPLSHPGNKFFAMISWGFFLVALLSVLVSDRSLEGFQRWGTSIHFLVAPFISILFVSSSIVPIRFFQGIKIGAITAGVVSIVQYFLYYEPDYRSHGTVNEIIFGNISVLLAFLALIEFFRESKNERLVSAISCLLGSIAALLSGARSVWVAALILLVALLFIWRIRGDMTLRRAVTVVFIFGIAATLAFNMPIFQQRYQLMVNELKGQDDYSEITPIRERVVMWESGWEAFLKSPVFGHGLHNTNIAVLPYIEYPHYKQSVSDYSHLHNEFVTTLVGKGLIGLASLLLVLFGPVLVLWKCLKSDSDFAFAATGLLLCAGYFSFGLTGVSFGEGIMNTFYAFMLSVIFHNVTLGESKHFPEEQVAD